MSTNHPQFLAAKNTFDLNEGKGTHIPQSIVPVGGKIIHNIKIRGANGQPNEEYFKWQFITSLIQSGLYAKDYIGCEVSFPKGNKTSHPIRMDAAIFDDADWINRYAL